LLTSPGPAAIAVLRLRGPLTADFVHHHLRATPPIRLDAAVPGQIRRATLKGRNDELLDDILVSFHATDPVWDLRLHLHGSPALVQQCTDLLTSAGWQPAPSAETHLWPATDRLEAEAYDLLPKMLTWRGVTWLLEQIETTRNFVSILATGQIRHDAVRPVHWSAREFASTVANQPLPSLRRICRNVAARHHIVTWFTTPLRIALVGPVNAGKSTLINALVDRPVSVVTPEPGTTRDWVEIPGELEGFPVIWLDTAGVRQTSDPLEAASVAQTMRLLNRADATVIVLDGSAEGAAARREFIERHADLKADCLVLNKADLEHGFCTDRELPLPWRRFFVRVSALQRRGLEDLQRMLVVSTGRADVLDVPTPYTTRQVHEWQRAACAPDRKSFRESLLRIVGEALSPSDDTATCLPGDPHDR